MEKNKVPADSLVKPTRFDKEEWYRSEIKPLADQLIKACTLHDVPVFVAVCTANDNSGSTYHYDGVSPEALQVELANDFFGKMLCVVCGFDTVLSTDDIPGDIDEGDASMRRISAETLEDSDS